MEWACILWFILLVLFVLMEASTVSLVSIWFAAGSLAALLAAALKGQVWLQIVLFAAVSCVLLACLRPVLRKHFTPKLTKTNVDALVGTTGYIQEAVDNVRSAGRVKLGGMEWSARSASGDPIPNGTLVKVDRIEGVKAYVSVVSE